MVKLVLKKLPGIALAMLLVSFLSFMAFSLISGNAATAMLGTEATPEKVAALEAEYGLDKPVLVQYAVWLKHALRGNFGISYAYHVPVSEVLAGKVGVTLTLTAMALLFMLLLAFPLGMAAAMREGTLGARLLQVLSQVTMAIPPFFLGMLLTLLFGLTLKLFTPGGYIRFDDSAGGFFAYLFFPALAMALPKAAMGGRFFKNALLSEQGKLYVQAAYSRGCTRRQAFFRHMSKAALIPMVSFFSVMIPEMAAGSLVVEQVFSVPGLGRILVASVANRDYPVVLAVLLLLTLLVGLCNLLADLGYHRLDKRVASL